MLTLCIYGIDIRFGCYFGERILSVIETSVLYDNVLLYIYHGTHTFRKAIQAMASSLIFFTASHIDF